MSDLIKPERDKFYTFGEHEDIKFVGITYDSNQDKVFVFSKHDSLVLIEIPKDEWYSEEFQKNLKKEML